MEIYYNKNTFPPKKATDNSAGYDIHAFINESIIINPGEIKLIKTGLYSVMEKGERVDIRPRSGLALKHGITVLNSPGTIDADYTGEWGVILINHGKEPFIIQSGMRIAQMIYYSNNKDDFINCLESDDPAERVLLLAEYKRDGFGSTGV